MNATNLHTGLDVGSKRKLMAPRASGQVVKPSGRRRSFSLRFRAYGERHVIKLGRPEDGWTMQMAERELAVVLRDVDLGTWRPPRPDPAPKMEVDPTFHEFASDWYATKELEVEPNTANHYRNDLTNHLLPFFEKHHLSQITVAEVDRYRQRKVREAAEITAAAESGKPMMVSYVDRLGRSYRRRARPLSARSINMHIDLLAQILAVAVDHGHLESNPAIGKRRRLKAAKPRPVHLDSAEQIALLLEAAGQLDRGEAVIGVSDRHGRTWTQRPAVQTTGRRAAIAALTLGGGRASATGAMVWRDVDLANGRFEVGRDKTDAGMREVDMLPLLREILTEHKAASRRTGPNDPVFVTSTGRARSRDNLRHDVVDAVVAHANRLVEERGLQPLPLGITPHKLRHTFASILVAIGKDPTYVMQQLGHTDPAFTLRVYAHAMRRSEEERERLKALVEGHDWAHIGHKTAQSASAATKRTRR
jgi:integrase